MRSSVERGIVSRIMRNSDNSVIDTMKRTAKAVLAMLGIPVFIAALFFAVFLLVFVCWLILVVVSKLSPWSGF